MATEKIYANNRFMGEKPEAYGPGQFHPVYLGDLLNERYHVFRKLGVGSQSTVWLAKDMSLPNHRYVALKVFSEKESEAEIKLAKILQISSHPGNQHVELALDSFIIHGPNGDHFCKVLEPLGVSLYHVIDKAFWKRVELNKPDSWRQNVLKGDPWSGRLAKQACWQILQGLDFLHCQKIAHRDIQPANPEDPAVLALAPTEADVHQNAQDEDENAEEESTSEVDSSSEEGSMDQWEKDWEEGKKIDKDKWATFEADPGDILAEPFSTEWGKANFLKSRDWVELIRRKDGQPLGPSEIRYTIAAAPLRGTRDLDDSSRLLLVDLGFACHFDECKDRTLHNVSDFRPPELLLGLPITYKADIFSAGLLFWEIVMLRRLIETHYISDDPGRVWGNNRYLCDLAYRLGSFPASLREYWRDADKFVDADGKALDMAALDGEEPWEPDQFEYGDIWHRARIGKPLEMSENELEIFVDLIKKMLRFKPEARPTTIELLQHEWFKDLQ